MLSLLFLLSKKYSKWTIKNQGEIFVEALKPLQLFNKKLQSIKEFVSHIRLHPEILNKLKIMEEQKQKCKRNKMLYKG